MPVKWVLCLEKQPSVYRVSNFIVFNKLKYFKKSARPCNTWVGA